MKNLGNNNFNYEQIINAARKVDPINFMDLAHDHIITGKSFTELKFQYKTVNEIDYTKYQGTTNTCNKCNQILPIACFRIHDRNGKTYTENVCRKCNTAKDHVRSIKTKNHVMKLVRIQIEDGRNNTSPAINFNGSAIFTINTALANQLKLSKGDRIDFFQDQEKPKDWYITVSTDNGCPVIFGKSGKYDLRKFQKRALYNLIRKSYGISEKSGTFLTGTPKEYDGSIYYQLLLKRSSK